MTGVEFVDALKSMLRVRTDNELADLLGKSVQSISNWKGLNQMSARRIAGVIKSARSAAGKSARIAAIRPLVEFFPITKCESRQGAKYELFPSGNGQGSTNPYLDGLRGELGDSHGVYLFFDSRGRALYVGKARRLSLWKEMKNAFNRDRGEVQNIMRVKHPSRNQAYKTLDEKSRQIDDVAVALHDLACYFSAYKVADDMIGHVEALLVRSFANDLLNVRMETFG
jgi:hypothetical protein